MNIGCKAEGFSIPPPSAILVRYVQPYGERCNSNLFVPTTDRQCNFRQSRLAIPSAKENAHRKSPPKLQHILFCLKRTPNFATTS